MTQLGSPPDRLATVLRQAFGGVDIDLDTRSVRPVVIGAGELLCEAGDLATSAWVVASGRVQVSSVSENGSSRAVGVLGPGDVIGESALLEDGRRRASVRALRRTEVIELDRSWLVELLSSQPEAALAVARTVMARSDRPVAPPAAVVAVVPLASTVVDEARQVADAAARCSRFRMADRELVADDDLAGDWHEWLDDAEREHGGVVLIGDPADRAWTTTITDIADRVVFVIDGDHGPMLGDLEQHLVRTIHREANATRLLVLVHPADADRPRRTVDWLDRREVDRHLHLRRRSLTDRHRVARHVIGRPLTMAIGAGGVRSAAAVGTVRAMDDRGVAIDAVAGISGGAIIAAWVALSTPIDQLEEKADWSMRKLLDYTIPVGAVVAGERAWNRIQEAVGDRDIADTWLPLSIGSTDLTAGEPVNHMRGRLADALYASISIPGVFPPVDIDGHLHVDGAVFDAIPVEGARALVPDGELVVVDLAPPHGRSTPPLPRVMKGSRLLIRRLVPGLHPTPVPNPLDTLMRSTTVAAARRRVEALESVDCHVHLDLSELSVLEFDKTRRIIELGHAQSVAPLDSYLGGEHPPLRDPVLAASGEAPDAPVPGRFDETEHRLSLASVGGSFSLAWCDLRFRALRFAVAGFASSVVLALLLQMTGVVNQLYREPRATVAQFGGTHWVIPADADGAFTSNATFDQRDVSELEGGRVLLARYRLAGADGTSDLDVILVGHDALPDGALELDDGRAGEAMNEVVLSTTAGYGVGDQVLVGPEPSVVSGTLPDASVFAGMPLVFVPLDIAQALVVGAEPLVSALIVEDEPELPDTLHAVESDIIADDALGPIERPISTLRLVQVLLAAVAALIIGAVVFLTTIDRHRDIAVVRAMGIGASVISVGVAIQALGVGLVSGTAALVIQKMLTPVFPLAIHLDVMDRVVLVVVAMGVAVIASYGAIRRSLRIDPVRAFSGPGG
jgi:predicted acylesterase/phospholipase RssA